MRSAERCADLMATFSSGVCMSCRPEATSDLTPQSRAVNPNYRVKLLSEQCQLLYQAQSLEARTEKSFAGPALACDGHLTVQPWHPLMPWLHCLVGRGQQHAW